jgi:peptidyl-prolyl cis-trans isomerase C
MKKTFIIFTAFVLFCFNVFLIGGCTSKKEEERKTVSEATQDEKAKQLPVSGGAFSKAIGPATVVVDVDGATLTQGQIDDDIKKNISRFGGKIPADRLEKFKDSMRKQLINQFVVRTLLSNEVNRLKIPASDKEVSAAIQQLKSSLPQGITIENILKKGNISEKNFREEIRLGIQTKKLVLSSMKGKTKPTDKEITAFYQKNKEMFKAPESVHARHILIATSAKDDDKLKAEKKTKAEEIRKSLMEAQTSPPWPRSFLIVPVKSMAAILGPFIRDKWKNLLKTPHFLRR